MFPALRAPVSILLLLLLPSLCLLAAASEPPGLQCRCLPGEPCWPSRSSWDALNASVAGRLVETVPLAHVCHDPDYDEQGCRALRARWTEPRTHYASSHSLMAPVHANNSCTPWSPREEPCRVGAYVPYAVNVSTAEDVTTAVRFARENNIQLVVRNTGHDHLGRSTAPGALALWTHHLTNLTLHPTWSSPPSPSSSPHYTGPAIHLGAGVQGAALNAFAAARGLVAVTGDCPSVGVAGGYLQGGGHSRLASRFGLAADQALAFDVIGLDAAGVGVGGPPGRRRRIVDAAREPELFWALRGGGPGAGGAVVVLGVTVRAYADVGAARARLVFYSDDDDDDDDDDEEERRAAAGGGERAADTAFTEAVLAFQAHLPALLDAGCAGQYTFSFSPRRGRFEMPLLVCYGTTASELRSLLAPLEARLNRVLSLPSPLAGSGTGSAGAERAKAKAKYDLRVDEVARYSEAARAGGVGMGEEGDYPVGRYQAGTWLVPRRVVASEVGNRALVEAVREIERRGGQVGLQAFSPTREVAADADDAVFAGWREAALLVWVILPSNDSAPISQQRAIQERISNELMPIIQAVSPDSGSYLNEADPLDKEWKKNGYGENYERLLAVKRRYDPDGLFYIHHGVGSDDWVQTADGHLCRVSAQDHGDLDEL